VIHISVNHKISCKFVLTAILLLHVVTIAVNLKFPMVTLLPGHQYERGMTFNPHDIDTKRNVHSSISSRFTRKGHNTHAHNEIDHLFSYDRRNPLKIRTYVKSTIAVPGEKLIQHSEH
jgi:hypothetical protein